MNGFTVENRMLRIARRVLPIGHTSEEAYSLDDDGQIMSVADGVTRDPVIHLPDTSKITGKIRFLRKYPNPSPASSASNIFTSVFPSILRSYQRQDRDEGAIRDAFRVANEAIADWGRKNMPDKDYLVNDLAGCVAAGLSFQRDDLFSWGYIADTGIVIFDEGGNIRFETEDEGPSKHNSHFRKDPDLEGLSWRDSEARRIIRSRYRNNPEEEHSFGVLTGEKKALFYVKTGTEELKPNEHAFVYTDGLEPIIYGGEFSDLLREGDLRGIEKLCQRNVETEGTLVHVDRVAA